MRSLIDLHEIQHVEVTVDLKADGTAAGQHAEQIEASALSGVSPGGSSH